MGTEHSPADLSHTAALLIAHGSRRAEANADLVRLADTVRATDQFGIVEIAYLELAEPDIPAGAEKCVQQGARRVLMMPYFLSAGVHVRNDLQQFQENFREKYPGVEFEVCEPLGLHSKLVEVVIERLREKLG
jgi:sirohydrochlorin ferrochelatase